MAQTNFTPISLYYSATATNVPSASNLVAGELAINTADGKLFYKDSSNVVQVIGTKGGVGSSTNTQVLYNASGLVVGDADMTFNGTTLTLANDASISGLTVGKGASSVATNTATGFQALTANTSGAYNTGVGYTALQANTSGSFNTGVGREALLRNTTGSNNTAFGVDAIALNTTGSYNTAVGDSALINNTTASNNTAVGYQAGYSTTTGGGNISIGYQSGYANTTSQYNIFIGVQAGYSTTGTLNTFIGNSATAAAGSAVTTGTKNSIFGGYNGNQGGLDIRTASNQIVLSDGDGNPRLNIGSIGNVKMNNPAASSGVLSVINTSNNSVNDVALVTLLGANAINTSSYALIHGQNGAGDKCYIYGNGNIVNINNSYGALSDAKLKENIVDSASQWNDIKNVRVRKYSMKADALSSPNMLGVVAQELEEAGMTKLVFESPDRQNEGETIKQVNYSILYMKAVKALQEAMERIETLEAKVTTLENK
jgi:hypothetical protein